MNAHRLSFLSRVPTVVKNLIIINIIFYIATLAFARIGINLIEKLAVFYFGSPFFRPWQIVTHLFMHNPNSFFHIFFNMCALFTFGTTLEYTMGSNRFLKFYFITALGAIVLQMLVQAIEVYHLIGSVTIPHVNAYQDIAPTSPLGKIYYSPMLGASGAIFGVLIGFGMLYPDSTLFVLFFPAPIKAKYLIIAYVFIEFFLGVGQLAGDSIAHFAHLGGALFGFLLIKFWKLKRFILLH